MPPRPLPTYHPMRLPTIKSLRRSSRNSRPRNEAWSKLGATLSAGVSDTVRTRNSSPQFS